MEITIYLYIILQHTPKLSKDLKGRQFGQLLSEVSMEKLGHEPQRIRRYGEGCDLLL